MSFYALVPNFGPAGAVITATIKVPKESTQFTVFEFTESMADNELVRHLNDNALYYSQAIWQSLDAATLALLLSPYEYGGKPVSQIIDPLPLSVAGNYLVFRMHADAETDPQWKEWLDSHGIDMKEVKEEIIPLPSGGVFAEAVLGRFNSAEKLDLTRFWNWQDSPIPFQAPEIAPIQTSSRGESDELKPGTFSQPLVNIVNPTQLPDPQGLSAIIGAIRDGNMFRDMSGLAAIIELAQAGLTATSTGAGQAASQAGTNLAAAARFIEAALPVLASMRANGATAGPGTQNGGDNTAPTAPNTVTNLGGTLEQARKLDEQEAQSTTAQTGQPTPPVQRRQEQVLRITEPPAKSTQVGRGTPTRGGGARPKISRLERVVQFFVVQPDSSVVVPGHYQFEIEEPLSGEGLTLFFFLDSGNLIGRKRIALPSGSWSVSGYVSIKVPEDGVNIPVKVLPGLDPITFTAESSLLDGNGKVYAVVGPVPAPENEKVISIFLRPIITEIKVEREITLSANATGTVQQNMEVQAGVKASGGVGVAEVEATGQVAVGASYSLSGTLGASQTLKLTMTFKVLSGFKFGQE